jgi:hypothetical protein
LDKEPSELLKARELLKEWEENPHDPESLRYLDRGLNHLSEVLTEESSPEHQGRARNLAGAYETKVVDESQKLISTELADIDVLDHWRKTMLIFSTAGFGSGAEFKQCYENLVDVFGMRILKALTPAEIEEIKRDLHRK